MQISTNGTALRKITDDVYNILARNNGTLWITCHDIKLYDSFLEFSKTFLDVIVSDTGEAPARKVSRIFVDKKTGIIRSDLKSSPEEILDIWSKKIFNSKNINDYSAFLPFARSRLYYTALTLIEFLNKKNIKKRIYCDYASGQGVLIDILQKIEKKKIIIATEGSKELSKNIEKKYNINCLNVSLGSGQIKEKNNNINPNIGFLNWTLCNCIDPLSVLRDVHNHLD